MKSDPDVRMIASDAPVLFCKACEIFIQEITCRAFLVADAHKRRTISKADIAKALAKSDHFDFLIDVVPRDEAERAKTQRAINNGLEAAEAAQDATKTMTEAVGQMSSEPSSSTRMPPLGGGPHTQALVSPTSQQFGHLPPGPMYQQGPPPTHMGMPSHHMGNPSLHQQQLQQQQPPPPSHQHPPHQRSHSHSHSHGHPMQHDRTGSGSMPSAPLNMTPIQGGPHGRPHSQSHSQSHPPPLIPNQHHPHPQSHQQQQQPGDQRRASMSRMSLSPTIPMSSSRMEPPT